MAIAPFEPVGFLCTLRYRRMMLQSIDGALDAAREDRLKAHLQTCPRCAIRYERQVFSARLIANYSIPEEPPGGKAPWQPSGAVRKDSRQLSPLLSRPVLIAASVLLIVIAGLTWRYLRAPAPAWDVVRLTGRPTVQQRLIDRSAKLSLGEWVETDGESRAMIQVGTLGQVEIDPNTRIRFLKADQDNYRLSLEHGKIYATILAPPRQFYVETPAALAIDLGCSYTLIVTRTRETVLFVTSGWVALNLNGRESLVPAGAVSISKPGIGPGTPYFEDATENLKAALKKFDFENGGPAELRTILSESRVKDVLTLWHLLARADGNERTEVYEKLASLSPPPDRVTRAGILSLNRDMLDAWRERLEYVSVGIDASHAPTATGSLKPVGNMIYSRFGHTATLLNDGRVLITGGREKEGSILNSAELYDPKTQQFSETGPMSTKRVGHTATLLPNGKVLITGGSTEEFFVGSLASAELFDPASGTFTPAGSMNFKRLAHRATLLKNGKVLITGGQSDEWANLSSAEIYDPANNSFTPAASMNERRADHTATVINDGRVLITGGAEGRSMPVNVSATAEIYDPTSNTFTKVGDMSVVRYKHSAALMPDGRVIVIGGSNAMMWNGQYASAEFYDPAAGKFTAAGKLNTARYKIRDAVVLLHNGKILVAGGGRAEIYDPATGLFGAVRGGMGTTRYYATATLLVSGEALIVGGYSSETGNMPSNTSAWLYQPE
ncbi:MAG TPA: kelch repeat-containing protein [Pyrinomonadaceae bacterium]|nr:kelch repeat-containing protein [Pyrinomonadaceae bacterium]